MLDKFRIISIIYNNDYQRSQNMKLGTYLRQARHNLNLKLRETESKTGISNAYLSQLENDKISNPSPIVLHKLADCYRLSYIYLMELAGYPTPKTPVTEKKISSSHIKRRIHLDNLTEEEENKLAEYLEFIRSRKRRK